MIIGLCGETFPHVRRALQRALPDDEISIIDVASCDQAQPVDVLVPLGADVDGELMDRVQPRVIQQFGVGLQGVDAEAAGLRGIPVTNLPAAGTGNADAVAEIAILHVLALLRRFPEAARSVTRGEIGQPCGQMLAGKAVTVLGVGAIGTAVIARLNAFGAIVYGVGRCSYEAYPGLEKWLPADKYYQTANLPGVLRRTQILIVCCPLTEQTRGLIGRQELAALAPDGYLVNVARGPVVEYDALVHALRDGRLAGAGMDVAWEEPINPADELLSHNVTVTPHIGGTTTESLASMAEAFADRVHRLISVHSDDAVERKGTAQ